jgi:hypothetical protein
MRKLFFSLSLAATLPLVAGAVDFEKELLPVFEAKCVECHKAPYEENGRTKKPKAGLRMDGAWAFEAGSENGSVLKAGAPDKSELFYRVTLPHDDDDFMPPSGKSDPLTEAEVALFKKWIEEGADFGDWIGNTEGKPADITKSGDKVPVSEIQEVYKRIAGSLPELKEEQWADVSESGARVARLAIKSPLVSVDFRLSPEKATPEAIGTIKTIAPHVTELDLSKTAIGDDALSIVAETPNVIRLNLSQTEVGDGALKQIGDLKELRYLNLYGTQVSDAGLKHLHSLKNLEAIYLWQSKASAKGAKALEQALPDAKVNLK